MNWIALLIMFSCAVTIGHVLAKARKQADEMNNILRQRKCKNLATNQNNTTHGK